MNGANFYTRIHRLGRITVILALVCFMAVPFGLSAVYGQPLDFAAIVENGAPIFLTFAISGICENLSFMPIIGSGAEIDGTVINSVISGGVKIGKGAIVRDSVIFSNVVIKENAIVEMSIIDENAEIGRRAVVGSGGASDITVIARNEKIADKTVIPAGEMYDTISGGAK